MRVSELIKKLQILEEVHGDLFVEVFDEWYDEPSDIQSAVYEPADVVNGVKIPETIQIRF